MNDVTAIEKLIFKAIESLDEKGKLVYQLHDLQGVAIPEMALMLKQSEALTHGELGAARRFIATWVQEKLLQASRNP